MTEEQMKAIHEKVIKEKIGDLKPSIKIDYKLENLVPSGSIEVHDMPCDLIGMFFMEIFAHMNSQTKTKEGREDLKHGLQLAVDIYDKYPEDLPEPSEYWEKVNYDQILRNWDCNDRRQF